MINYLILITVSFVFLLPLKSQHKHDNRLPTYTHIATYKLTYFGDSTDMNNPSTDYWYLFLNDTSSFFTSVKFLRMDSIKREERLKGNPYGPSMDWYMANGTKNTLVVYKNTVNETIICHDKLAPNESEHFVYEDTDPMEWDLNDETISIGGHLCQQAKLTFGGRNWIAWYNPEIPLHDGPYKFFGLPGLIYQIEDDTKSWRYELINLKQEEQIIDFNCSDADHQHVSKDNFYTSKRDYYDNRIIIMKSIGYHFKDEARAKREYDKDNNWIELYP